jgi:hypothetical protein
MEEWIGSFAQPDIGNLPHPLTQQICAFAWPDMPNLPPRPTQLQFRGFQGHDLPNAPLPLPVTLDLAGASKTLKTLNCRSDHQAISARPRPRR